MNELKKEMIKGILFVSIVGTLWHFVYEWSGQNPIVGLFFPVNESTWEHMKLLFFPMLLYTLYAYKKLKDAFPCIPSALLYGILSGTFLIPVLFYTYKGILGSDYIALDIAVFIGIVMVAFWNVYKYVLSCRLSPVLPLLIIAVIAIAVCFFIFTYYPPAIGLFAVPGK